MPNARSTRTRRRPADANADPVPSTAEPAGTDAAPRTEPTPGADAPTPSAGPARAPRAPRARAGGAVTTATGKPAEPDTIDRAAQAALEGVRARTEEGHRAAGRTPPTQDAAGAAATRTLGRRARSRAHPPLDTSIRDYPHATEDEKLLALPRQGPSTAADFTRTDPWRVMRIMGEFIEGFDALSGVRRGVTIFGSARTAPDDPQYQAAQEVGRLLAEAGFDVITGAGPGSWRPATAARATAAATRSGATSSCRSSRGTTPTSTRSSTSATSSCGRRCSSSTRWRSSSSPAGSARSTSCSRR
jgi:hypothetical protein